ncbi:NfeD family protein [Hydrogenimonas urashimensis]|uniref:NfeD family protein n=1 Tax=Hydrogenimonas urashimensis TaxID=2740515 RepID=UPI001915DA1D|nr:NfeD family protein [Hydrogenimonas urashimensis]
MEYLGQYVLWWHWIVLGILLIAAEILIPSFVVIWFGIAALVVGGLDFFFQTSFTQELFLWTGISATLLAIYFLFFKKSETVPNVGQSEGEYADIPGVVIEVLDEGRYRARFDLPVLGDRVWIVEAENGEVLKEGDRVLVDRVYGQIIKVRKEGT